LSDTRLCLVFPAQGFTISIQPINVGQGGVGGSGFTASQVALLETSASVWEQLITGYQSGITLTGVSIEAYAVPFDGVGNTFAEAGPVDLVFQQGLFLTTTGFMEFDIADLGILEAAGTLQSVMVHEIAHVLGFGTLWSLNGLYVEGSGQYTGSAGVAAYRSEFVPGASFVPVELGGGAATRDLHWNEVDGGLSNTGITDSLGRDFGDEIMTGWTGPTPANRYISQTTLRSFEDLGFTVVPEPSACLLLMSTAWLICGRRRRDLVAPRSGGTCPPMTIESQ